MNDQPGTYEEWRVTGEPGPGYPSYWFVWSARYGNTPVDAEAEARAFVQMVTNHRDHVGWDDGPHLAHRTVVIGEWTDGSVG